MTTCICVTPNQAQMLLDCKISTIQNIVLINSDDNALKNLRDSSADRVRIHDIRDILVRYRKNSFSLSKSISVT